MVAFSPHGDLLATTGQNGDAELWDGARGTRLRTLPAGLGGVGSVAFSPNGRNLVTSGDRDTSGRSGLVRVWSVPGGSNERALAVSPGLEHAVFSTDGREVAAGGDDGKVRTWNIASGRLIHTLAPRRGSVYLVAYSYDGRYLAAGTPCGTVVVWDAHTGRRLAILLEDTDYVGQVLFESGMVAGIPCSASSMPERR